MTNMKGELEEQYFRPSSVPELQRMSKRCVGFVRRLKTIRHGTDSLLNLQQIVDSTETPQIVSDIDSAVTALRFRTGFVHFSALTVDSLSADNTDDELVALALDAIYQTGQPRLSAFSEASRSTVASCDRLTVHGNEFEVPLSTNEMYNRNWKILFEFISAELSALEADLQKIERRIAVDGGNELLDDWRRIQDRIDLIRAEQERRAEHLCLTDEFSQQKRTD